MAAINTNKTIYIGADPELFLKDQAGNYVSAIGKFEGTKEAPVPIYALGNGYAEQVDNVLVEYNIPPAPSKGQWLESHTKMISYLRNKANKMGLNIHIDASAVMPESELANPFARVFGCDPDFNAWTMELNAPPRAADSNLRSAGGHIHIGMEGMSDIDKINTVRYLDLTIGAWSVIDDPDLRRKELYGRPGAMRFKPYGLEYRTVSNFWLLNNDFLLRAWSWAYDAARIGPSFRAGKYQSKMKAMFDHNDKDIAKNLVMDINGDTPW